MLQSVVFLRPKWNVKTSKLWLEKKGITPLKEVDIVKKDGKISQYRYRILNPKRFKRFITKKTKDNINFIIGY